MSMDPKISQLVETSKNVIMGCCLENGAIVAANTDKPEYPKNANNYRFVWPRDVSFILYAANIIGINEIQKPFIAWMMERAEDFSESGMIFQRYSTNGLRDTEFGHQYQPDQAGSLLWSLSEICNEPDEKFEKIISLLADGLCRNWDRQNFVIPTHDLWEERSTFPKLNDNFSYTLAACSHGLELAYKSSGNEEWLKVSNEMRNLLQRFGKDHYPRVEGRIPDKRIDASILGLVWPFNSVGIDKKLLNSIEMLKKKLMTPEGIKRYENDEYDSTIENLNHWKKGGGGWPLLTFWYVIALAKTNHIEEAKILFDDYIKHFRYYIPEQMFNNKIQVSVSPMCWSHAMFIIAARELVL